MDKKIKNREDRKLPFNIIDIFILLFVLACFVGIVLKIGNFGVFKNSDDLDEYRIYFSVSEIAHTSGKYFAVGDSVTLAGKNTVMGKLEQIISIEPTKAYVKGAEKNIISLPYPVDTRVDVKGSILSMGTMESTGYMLGGAMHIAAGESYYVTTEHLNFLLTVTDIVKK